MSKEQKVKAELREVLSFLEELFDEEWNEHPLTVSGKRWCGDTPLHTSISRGEDANSIALIEGGSNLDALGDMSETPLHIAVWKENSKLVKLLLEKGASPDIVSEFGVSPKQLSMRYNAEVRKLFK